ncbi:MAG: hypothetical protein ACRBN8_38925 [Nannocystales bacterium]
MNYPAAAGSGIARRAGRPIPGNVEWPRRYLLAAERWLVLTLGVEAAAFARCESFSILRDPSEETRDVLRRPRSRLP